MSHIRTGEANSIPVSIAAASAVERWVRDLADRSVTTPNDSLLPVLLQQKEHWPKALTESNWQTRIDASIVAGWRLSHELPADRWAPPLSAWLGRRLVFWPEAIARRRRVGIVSSRLTRALDDWVDWFRVLRSTVAGSDDNDLLLLAEDTSTAAYLQRAAELFGKSTLRISTPDPSQPVFHWLTAAMEAARRPASAHAPVVFVSPVITGNDGISDDGTVDNATTLNVIPERDRVLVGTSHLVCALHVRRGGHVERMLRYRLGQWPSHSTSVRLALGQRLVEPTLRDSLLGAGAVGLTTWVSINRVGRGAQDQSSADANERSHSMIPGRILQGSYLTHCTRRRIGPWPGQSPRQYHDDLLLERDAAKHSAFESLKRIVVEQRLRASTEGIRGGVAVVSLTSVPLSELAELRVFRPHRGRWDFEPYGLCIAACWLGARGTRPVEYITDEQRADVEQVAFCQKHQSITASSNVMDWSVEQEWRHVGDLDLRSLPAEGGFAFVPSSREADALRTSCRWPIYVLAPP